jgi:glycosyltransferase involved in cell wall biosynthesis
VTATVAICTWNRAALLDQTLERFRRLVPPRGATWELLVVNNNCTDETDAIVRKYESTLPVRLIHERTPGKVHALNRCIDEATGEFLLFTDDDALVEPNWLTEVLAGFNETDADMVFGKVRPWWETAPPKWFGDTLAAHFALLDYGDEPFVADSMRRSPFGVNYAFRKAVFDEIGPYKTDLGPRGGQGFGGEDDEIFRRMLRHNKKVVYRPSAVVNHFVPVVRCEKAYHRMRAWRGSTDHLNLLRDEAAGDPKLATLLGIPRYFFRANLSYVAKYFAALLRFDRPAAFFYEMKMIRLAGLLKALTKRTPKVEAVPVERREPAGVTP